MADEAGASGNTIHADEPPLPPPRRVEERGGKGVVSGGRRGFSVERGRR